MSLATLWKRAKAAPGFAVGMAQFIANGFRIVSDEKHCENMKTCESCDKISGSLCNVCSCYLPFKTLIVGQKCPLDKWSNEET
jgi:hypothetical protein